MVLAASCSSRRLRILSSVSRNFFLKEWNVSFISQKHTLPYLLTFWDTHTYQNWLPCLCNVSNIFRIAVVLNRLPYESLLHQSFLCFQEFFQIELTWFPFFIVNPTKIQFHCRGMSLSVKHTSADPIHVEHLHFDTAPLARFAESFVLGVPVLSFSQDLQTRGDCVPISSLDELNALHFSHDWFLAN